MRTQCLFVVAAAFAASCQTVPGATSSMDASPTGGDAAAESAVPMDDNPTNVHINWSDDPSTTIAPAWSTTINTVNGYVNYGTSPTALTQMSTGTVSTVGMAQNTVTVHEAHITGLTPNTTYYYQVGTPGHWSATYHFKTAPMAGDPNADMNFVAFGDSADSVSDWQSIQGQVDSTNASAPPDFFVFSGDAVPLGTVQSAWNGWFAAAANHLANAPFILAHGNHDALAVNYIAQFTQPTLPGGKLYFSLNVGPVHFVILNDTPPNQDYTYVTGTEANFLTTDLMAVDRTMTPWVIAVHHKPCYDTSMHSADTDVVTVRAAWPPIYDRFHVDLVLNAHDHDLEITHPLVAGAVVSTGTTYITSGGAGAVLYMNGTSSFTLYSEMVENFLNVHVTPHMLDLHAFRGDGTEVSQAHLTLTH